MADRVIVVEKKRGCGCSSALLLLIIAVVGLFVYIANDTPTIDSESRRAADDPNTPRPFLDGSDLAIIEMHFTRGLRDCLLDPDSYKPHGSPRVLPHPKGQAFFRDFTAKNAFGGPARQVAGLLYCTNKAETAWTFYSPKIVSELLDECKIKGAK